VRVASENVQRVRFDDIKITLRMMKIEQHAYQKSDTTVRRKTQGAAMYENHKLCDELKPKEICIVVEQYKEGTIERKYHLHIPKHRLSETSLQYLLQCLVMKFENK
jgi:hypothetical protein